MFGKDSFYAKAPRISNWAEFKNKIIEMEAVERPESGVEFSDKFMESVSGFVNKKIAPPEETNNQKYRSYLQTKKERIIYAVLITILIFVAMFGIDGFFKDLNHHFFQFISVFLIISGLVFSFLTTFLTPLNSFINKFIPYWHKRKDLRLLCFGSLYWAIGVFLYVALFDPYNDGNWKYMDDWGICFLP